MYPDIFKQNEYQTTLSPLAAKLIKIVEHEDLENVGEKISVNPVVSEIASFYENIRNSMEYQEEEVVFRAAIERILKRRLLLESKGEKIAEPLIKELAWAKYFPDNTVPHAIILEIAKKINLYIKLYKDVPKKHSFNKGKLNEWILQVMSSDIAFAIRPNKETQSITDFMFHIFQKKVTIVDDNEENRNALIFIGIKRALAKEDKAFLRYHLFTQYFGEFNESSYNFVLEHFLRGYQKAEQVFKYPLNDAIYLFIKKRAVPFMILKDVFNDHKEKINEIVSDPNQLSAAILKTCEKRYKEIGKKVRTAILRSVIFLFATKAVFALLIEGTFEKFVYGHIVWGSMALNTLTPPLLMFFMIFFIKTPNRENSLKILEKVKSILYEEQVSAIKQKDFKLHSKPNPMRMIFTLLWFILLAIGILRVNFVLNLFKVNMISQVIFIFFFIIVSFLIYRINKTAKTYNVEKEKEGIRTVLSDFFLMPFVQLGSRITLSFSKINIFLMLFDFIIEMPFKTLFAFFEQWFSFLKAQRERLD